jgi:flagellar biogenesis protein FliO
MNRHTIISRFQPGLTLVAAGLLGGVSGLAQTTNSALTQYTNSALTEYTNTHQDPDGFTAVLRVFGALALVIGLFLAGVWLFRNWQRLSLQRGNRPKLNILETRALGGRQALYVVGYEQARFLIGASPAGLSLLSHLPEAAPEDIPAGPKTATPFAATLAQLLKGK